jgi:hypothetical protein
MSRLTQRSLLREQAEKGATLRRNAELIPYSECEITQIIIELTTIINMLGELLESVTTQCGAYAKKVSELIADDLLIVQKLLNELDRSCK